MQVIMLLDYDNFSNSKKDVLEIELEKITTKND